MNKNLIGPFSIVGADDLTISSAKDVTISLHDDLENIIRVAVKSDLLQVIAQQLVAAAKQAESGLDLAADPSFPVVIEASRAIVVREPGQGLFFIFEVSGSLSYIFPVGLQMATRLRDELTNALAVPLIARTMN